MGTKASTVLLLLALIALSTTYTVAKKVDPEQQEQHAHGGQQSKQLKECQTQCERQAVPAQQKQVCSKQCVEKFSERQQEEEARAKKRQEEEAKAKKRQEEEAKAKKRQEEGGKGKKRNPWQRQEEEEEWEGQEEEEGSNPYVFEQHHFQSKVVETEHGRVSFLPKFTKRSKLFRGLENFRFGLLEADPQTFIVPSHYDAEAFLIVAAGRGTITLIQENKRRTINVKQGDIIRVPAGTPVYGTNQDENERLFIVKLLQPVNSPGQFEIYNGAGGQNPESFFNAFSWDLLEAAFQTDRSELESLFGQQQQGPFVKASKEQIQALSGGSSSESDSEANDNDDTPAIWPFGDSKGSKKSKGKSSSSDFKFNLFNKSPSFSNQHGQLFIVDKDDFKQLQDFDLAISFANITKGSMLGPYFNSRSTKISIVLDGEGYIEMACPHLAKQHQQQQPWSTDPYRTPYQGHQGRSSDPYQSPYERRQGRSTDPYQSSPYQGRQGRWSEPRHQRQEQEQERWSEPRHQGQGQERWSEPRHQGQGQERWSEPRHQRQGQWPRHQGQEQEQTSFQQVKARLSRGTVFITPAGHPAAAVASRDSNLQIVCFEVNADNNVKYPLTGKNNVVGLMEREAQELAFNFPSKDVQRIFKSQSEQFFFPGPKRQQQQGRGGGYAADE